ncbi:hypothetical protein P7K49_015191 [Saguinus oedipus]|uniref:C2 domain-containing protein n=1 Tax=Saguinus oedipus TaxID=9490 RepID=A0ABQ9V8I6_SAGOE|nr:hypothetical protein P7K49_015191 [Saguinus oedipus]
MPDTLSGMFNPNSEDPLPGQLKKQLVLRIISGQQLPKPRDSMLGDRGEVGGVGRAGMAMGPMHPTPVSQIIDPFVEVEVIGLPVDCSREQTRVVDDNGPARRWEGTCPTGRPQHHCHTADGGLRLELGPVRGTLLLALPPGFNPTWEETLVFTVHMPEIALVRFLVWDHDPIGRDFIGQRTLAFSSMMPGYRHVYLEGMEEASIFVHVAVSDISGKGVLEGLAPEPPVLTSDPRASCGSLGQCGAPVPCATNACLTLLGALQASPHSVATWLLDMDRVHVCPPASASARGDRSAGPAALQSWQPSQLGPSALWVLLAIAAHTAQGACPGPTLTLSCPEVPSGPCRLPPIHSSSPRPRGSPHGCCGRLTRPSISLVLQSASLWPQSTFRSAAPLGALKVPGARDSAARHPCMQAMPISIRDS